LIFSQSGWRKGSLFGKSGDTPRSPFEREANQKMEVPLVRVKITLSCTECKQRNYNTMKEKKNNPDRLEMKKYCRFCKKHTLHRETK
jgi:large subunit ribosomal protein L33